MATDAAGTVWGASASAGREVLRVSGLQAGYGAARVLHGIDLVLHEGETLVVLGRNGVGKTTLIETIIGLTTWHAGSIRLGDRAIEKLPAHARNQAGIGWVPQEREVFKTLTVLENLQVVARKGRWTPQRVFELFPRLAERRRNLASQLSGGEQQMLSIGRALMTDPTVLLLDEPVEGLAPIVVREMIAAIDRMRREERLSILLVEQKHDVALANSDRCIVLDHGQVVHEDRSAAMLGNAPLLERLLAVAA